MRQAPVQFRHAVLLSVSSSHLSRLLEDFAAAFGDADVLLLTPIYPAGEKPIEGVTSERLAQAVCATGHGHVVLCPSLDAVLATLKQMVQAGDLVITLGAGDVGKLGNELLRCLAEGAGDS